MLPKQTVDKMNKENKIHKVWPIHIGEFYNPDHEEIKSDLIAYFKEYIKNKPGGRKASENYNLFESEYNLHSQSNPTFNKLLKEFIVKGFLTMAKEVNKHLLEVNDKDISVSIVHSWFIQYEKGGFVLPHTHISRNCSWSCVYYLQLGKDATKNNGATYFQKTTPSRLNTDYGSIYDKSDYTKFTPMEGKMLIWPSHISHGSLPYEGTDNKIIISANARMPLMENGKPIIS